MAAKEYIVVRDRQDTNWAMGVALTADEWVERARAWAQNDDDTDMDNALENIQKHREDWTDQQILGLIDEAWDIEFRSKADIVEDLQGRVRKNHLATIKELSAECGDAIEPYEDVLSPMGWNCCDKCGDMYPSEELIWTDYIEYDESNPKDRALKRGLELEMPAEDYYGALCDDCVKEIIKKGENGSI